MIAKDVDPVRGQRVVGAAHRTRRVIEVRVLPMPSSASRTGEPSSVLVEFSQRGGIGLQVWTCGMFLRQLRYRERREWERALALRVECIPKSGGEIVDRFEDGFDAFRVSQDRTPAVRSALSTAVRAASVASGFFVNALMAVPADAAGWR